jgi:hypothetical protein
VSTRRLRISPYVLYETSGSDISNSQADPPAGGYDVSIALELERLGGKGGTIELSAPALRDLAEWCDALTISVSQGGNPAGARSLAALAEKALRLAAELEAGHSSSTP